MNQLNCFGKKPRRAWSVVFQTGTNLLTCGTDKGKSGWTEMLGCGRGINRGIGRHFDWWWLWVMYFFSCSRDSHLVSISWPASNDNWWRSWMRRLHTKWMQRDKYDGSVCSLLFTDKYLSQTTLSDFQAKMINCFQGRIQGSSDRLLLWATTNDAMETQFFDDQLASVNVVTWLKACVLSSGINLECLKIWGGKKRSYIVASRSGDSHGVANCFVSCSSFLNGPDALPPVHTERVRRRVTEYCVTLHCDASTWIH